MVHPPDGTPPALAWAALALATLILGISKSGFGGGIAILAVPLVGNALQPQDALGVLLPLLIAADAVAFVQHRRHASPAILRPALAGALLGIGIGSFVLFAFQRAERLGVALRLLVGTICLALVALQIWRWAGGRAPRLGGSRRRDLGAGGVCGVVSTLAHAAGPLLTLYLLERELPKRTLVATLVVFFFAVNAAKVPTYVVLGLLNLEVLATAAVFVPLVPLGAWIGLWMHHRVPERPFALALYLASALAGARLLLQGLSA